MTTVASYSSTRAYAAVILLNSGDRRRWGTYHDPNSNGQCLQASTQEMSNACANLIAIESTCHNCLSCESATCMDSIYNCDDFLATVFPECCEGDCDLGQRNS